MRVTLLNRSYFQATKSVRFSSDTAEGELEEVDSRVGRRDWMESGDLRRSPRVELTARQEQRNGLVLSRRLPLLRREESEGRVEEDELVSVSAQRSLFESGVRYPKETNGHRAPYNSIKLLPPTPTDPLPHSAFPKPHITNIETAHSGTPYSLRLCRTASVGKRTGKLIFQKYQANATGSSMIAARHSVHLLSMPATSPSSISVDPSTTTLLRLPPFATSITCHPLLLISDSPTDLSVSPSPIHSATPSNSSSQAAAGS